MNERIKQIRKFLGLNQTEFGERLSLQFSTISAYERGERTPSSAVISYICKEFHISEAWLRTGEGEMLAPQNKEQEIADIAAKLFQEDDDSFRFKLIKLLAQMDEKQMAAVKEFAEKLTKE